MDLVACVEQLPWTVETLHAREFLTTPGGKGANQAIAAAWLGVPTRMLGCVGEDTFGEDLIRSLKNGRVETSSVVRTQGYGSGLALIHVNAAGENAIALWQSAENAAHALQRRKARNVILKMGEPGALYLNGECNCTAVPAFRIQAIESTAAGDGFTAALAVGLRDGLPLPASTRFA